jgi:hypothetical protein
VCVISSGCSGTRCEARWCGSIGEGGKIRVLSGEAAVVGYH